MRTEIILDKEEIINIIASKYNVSPMSVALVERKICVGYGYDEHEEMVIEARIIKND